MSQEFDIATVTLNPAIDRTVTIENFTVGEVNRVVEYRSDPAGKGVNVASALADFGYRLAVTGFLGRENAGSFEALFAKKHIGDRFVRIAGQTRVGIKITDPVQNETTDINFPGASPTPSDIEKLGEQLAGIDAAWFVLAGSLPPGVDPGIYGDLTTALKGRGRKVALDTSGESLEKSLHAGPDLIKPNNHELEALLGISLDSDDSVIDAARRLVDRGIELVVVSMGAKGACYVTKDEAVIARSPRVEVRSTVGAGDAMVAGTVAGRLRQLSLSDCARMGTAFSLEALSRIESGISSPEAIEAAMATVTTE
jgi:1-phosphofructokinase